ncbi:MAG: hypothetical protein RBR15_17560 [Sphaerochaeta sp.]|nr:hypothetical protein [Sphaerochaeta sp.]
MNNYETIKSLCTQTNRNFACIEPLILDWKKNTTKVKKVVQSLNALDTEVGIPEGYGRFSAATYLYAQVLTDGAAIKKMLAQQGSFLTSSARETLAYWGEHPGFWCFFAIEQIMEEKGFLTVVDLSSRDKHLVYSTALCDLQQTSMTRDKHYLCLLLPNGKCLQTAGMIRYYPLDGRDLRFYCSMFDPDADLGSVINNHYVRFIKLDLLSSQKVPMHKQYELRKTWQPFTLKEFDVSKLAGAWVTITLGEQQKFFFNDTTASMMTIPNAEILPSELPMMGGTLVRQTSTGAMGLVTNSEVSYKIFSTALNRAYPELKLPENPEVSIFLTLVELLNMGDFPLPWKQFEAIMQYRQEEGKTTKEDATSTQDDIDTYFQRYRKNYGSEVPPDENISLSTEEIEDAVHEILGKFIKTYEVKDEDKPIEFQDCPNPSLETRMNFFLHLVDNAVFMIDDDKEAFDEFAILTNGAYTDAAEDTGIAAFIEDLFVQQFPSDDEDLPYILMNAFFWVLLHKGRQWAPMRSYAIEMLKLFPTPIIKAYPEGEDFIQEFSMFTRKILATHGICSLKARPRAAEVATGMYPIKGSEPFFTLVRSVVAY